MVGRRELARLFSLWFIAFEWLRLVVHWLRDMTWRANAAFNVPLTSVAVDTKSQLSRRRKSKLDD